MGLQQPRAYIKDRVFRRGLYRRNMKLATQQAFMLTHDMPTMCSNNTEVRQWSCMVERNRQRSKADQRHHPTASHDAAPSRPVHR
jgi:hypothetical protein